jgi:5-methylcytosine-specific restriction endonuclease McrA
MVSDTILRTWYSEAKYKFVWDRDTLKGSFSDYIGLLQKVVKILIKEHSSCPENADLFCSPEIGIISLLDTENIFAVYIAHIKLKEIRTTLFSEFKGLYETIRIVLLQDIDRRKWEEINGDKEAYIAYYRSNERKQLNKLNKHFKTLANKSLNHRRIIPIRLRYLVLLRDDSTCQICGRKAPHVQIEVDHKIPVSWDNNWKISNKVDDYQALCKDCNLGKSDMLWI